MNQKFSVTLIIDYASKISINTNLSIKFNSFEPWSAINLDTVLHHIHSRDFTYLFTSHTESHRGQNLLNHSKPSYHYYLLTYLITRHFYLLIYLLVFLYWELLSRISDSGNIFSRAKLLDSLWKIWSLSPAAPSRGRLRRRIFNEIEGWKRRRRNSLVIRNANKAMDKTM